MEASATLQGPGQFGYNPASSTSVNRNIWPAVTQFNLHLAYDLFPKESGQALQVYLNIDNLLDKDPPLAWASISNYDPMGRYFRLGLRYRTD
jgi:outer membrane receptor protein involved in Fe transport